MNSSFAITDAPVNDLEVLFSPGDQPYRVKLKGIIIIFVTAGSGIMKINHVTYFLRKGMLFSIFPSRIIQIIEKDDSFRCVYLFFTFDFMADFPYLIPVHVSEKMQVIPALDLTPEQYSLLIGYFQTISFNDKRVEHPSYKAILRSYLFIFVAEISNIYMQEEIKTVSTHYEKITDQFFHLLHLYIRENRQVTFYSERLCMTYKYLSKVIREVTGFSPSYWIADFTIKEAKSLLKSTTKTITQLSEDLNFPNSSFFARYFRRYTGMSPARYREQK